MRQFVRSAVAMAAVAAFSASAQAQQVVTLKMQATWPASLTLYENFTYFVERVGKISNGSLKIDAMPAGQVVPAFEVLDAVESAEADIQEDLEFALVQMKSETLNKVNDALARLEQGSYGNCFDCGEEIAEKRLRALPFAVRCKDCEEARETAEQRERQLTARRGASSLFMDM